MMKCMYVYVCLCLLVCSLSQRNEKKRMKLKHVVCQFNITKKLTNENNKFLANNTKSDQIEKENDHQQFCSKKTKKKKK